MRGHGASLDPICPGAAARRGAGGARPAIGAFGPPVSIDDPACEFDLFNVDQAQDASGVTHGFTTLAGTGWTSEATPYRGFVVAVAWDSTGTYLL